MNKFTKYRLAGELETTVSGKLRYPLLLDIVDVAVKHIYPAPILQGIVQLAGRK